jgi:PTH1 family peptidyl-tRNA hydrolase
MNLSGEAVVSGMGYFKIKREDILVIYDDISLSLGKIRIRENGSDGGHNGLKSIQHALGSQDYKRIRIGIDEPKHYGSLINHVLSDFNDDELNLLVKEVFPITEEALKLIIKNNIKEAMNRYNGYLIGKSEKQS